MEKLKYCIKKYLYIHRRWFTDGSIKQYFAKVKWNHILHLGHVI